MIQAALFPASPLSDCAFGLLPSFLSEEEGWPHTHQLLQDLQVPIPNHVATVFRHLLGNAPAHQETDQQQPGAQPCLRQKGIMSLQCFLSPAIPMAH